MTSLKHIIIKLSQIKDKRILKEMRERNSSHKREPLLVYHQISQQKTFRPRENGLFKVLEEKLLTKILYPAKLSFKNEG